MKLRMQNLILIVFTIAIQTGCASLNQVASVLTDSAVTPKAEVKSTTISALSLSDITLDVGLLVSNPNPFGIQSSGMNLDLSVNDKSLAKIQNNDQPLSISANGQNTITLPVTITFKDLANIVGDLSKLNEVNYSIGGNIGVDVPVIGNRQLPVNYTSSIPVPKIPKIDIKKVELGPLTLQGTTLNVVLDIENSNKFGIDISDFLYKLNANGRQLISGELSQFNMNAEGQRELSVPLDINVLQLGTSLFRAISSGDPIKFDMTGEGNLGTSLPFWKPGSFKYETASMSNK